MALGLLGFDTRAIGDADCLVGIDEAGRGCLAGPVVAAAIRCEGAFYRGSWCRRHSRGVDDSKRLSPARRREIVARFAEACDEKWIRIGIGTAGVGEIERHNIYHATSLAMRRALEQVLEADDPLWCLDPRAAQNPPVPVLIDGRPIRTFPRAHRAVVKGDQRSLAIALAGIHAKEWRDARMRELEAAHPGYGFAVHKGYGTEAHMQALRRHGPCPEHRPSFLRKLNLGGGSGPDATQCSLF